MKGSAILVAAALLGGGVFYGATAHAAPGKTRDPVAVCGTPNGCGPKGKGRAVRDNWGNVSFTPACNAHDNCYATPGKTQRQCDDAFRKDLHAACNNAKGAVAPVAQCIGIAENYYQAVSLLGGGAYKDAQQCSGRVQLENERSDADALIAFSLAEASKQGTAAMQEVHRASSQKIQELEAIAAEARAAYERIKALHAAAKPASPSPASAPAPAPTGKYVLKEQDHYAPKGIDLPKPTDLALVSESAQRERNLRAIEAKAKPIIDSIQQKLLSARNVHSTIHTMASTTAVQSSERRGKEVRTLATEAKTAFGKAMQVAIALQKVAAARTKYFAFRTDIKNDITAQTSTRQQSLERTVLPMEHEKHEVLMLRNEAERIAKGETPPPKRELVPRTPVLPGVRR